MKMSSIHRRIVLCAVSGTALVTAFPVLSLAQKAAGSNESGKPVQPAQTPKKDDPTYIPQPSYTLNPAVPKPSNPLVMDDLNTKTGNAAALYDNSGHKVTPLLPDTSGAINPDAATQFSDPGQRNTDKATKSLPLFGYDFFSSTRQLIEARRIYLQRRYQLPGNGLTLPYQSGQRTTPIPNVNGQATWPQGYNQNPNSQYPYSPYPQQNGTALQPSSLVPGGSGYQQPYGYPSGPQAGYPAQPTDHAYPGPVYNPYALSTPTASTILDATGAYSQPGQYPNAAYPGYGNQTYLPSYPPYTGSQQYQNPQGYPAAPNAYGQYSGPGTDPNWAPAQGYGPYSPYAPSQGSPTAQAGYAPNARPQSNAQSDDQTSQPVPSLDPYASQIQPVTDKPAPHMQQQPSQPQVANPATMGWTNPDAHQGTPVGAYPSAQADPTSLPIAMTPGTPTTQPQLQPSQRQPSYQQYTNQPQMMLPAPETTDAGTSIDAFHEVADPLSQLFRNVQQSLPPDYQLNPGDTVTLRMWSPTIPMREFKRTIDARGFIYLTDIGPQVVRGLTASQAENSLREKLRRMYRDMDVSINLAELRTMNITVSGAAFSPGSYTVPAGTTAFNLLYAAGGPTLDGSLRSIEIRRRGDVAGTIDLYSFILGGGEKADMPLQAGDIVYVPQRLSRVSVHGEVRHQAIFEAKDSDSLSDLLRFAGGVKPSGVVQHVQLNTFQPGQARILKDIDLTDSKAQKSTSLYDGDDVDVFSVRAEIVNRVTIDGAVDQPGNYAIAPGMKLSDLIERARGPIEDAYTTRADLYRWNSDNTLTLIPVNLDRAVVHDPASDIALVRWDRIHVYTRQEVQWTGRREVLVRGAVQRPGTYYRSDNMHAKDLLLQAGGTLPEAYLNHAVLLHQHPDGAFTYDYVNVADALKDGGDPGPAILDNDILAVYKVGEAQFTRDHLVTIRGRVVSPGIYPRGEGMRLSNLLQLAGGFVPGAAFSLQLTHVPKIVDGNASQQTTRTISLDGQHSFADNDDQLLEDGDVVTVQGVGGIYDNVRVVTVAGSVNRPGPIPVTKSMRLSDAIKLAGGLRPEAYPDGAEFVRNPVYMTTSTQQTVALTIKRLNELLNGADYKRQQAKSDVERIQAIQDVQTSSSTPALGALTGQVQQPAVTPSPNAAANLANRDLVSPPRVLEASDLVPNGNVAINLGDAINRPGSRADFLLMDGDTITVPEQPTTVQVVGAVFNSRGVLFKPGASLEYYLNQAGGFAPDAAKDRIEIIRAGGGLILASKADHLAPGDVILVPTKVLAANIRDNHNSLNEIFAQVTNSAILFKIVTSLIK